MQGWRGCSTCQIQASNVYRLAEISTRSSNQQQRNVDMLRPTRLVLQTPHFFPRNVFVHRHVATKATPQSRIERINAKRIFSPFPSSSAQSNSTQLDIMPMVIPMLTDSHSTQVPPPLHNTPLPRTPLTHNILPPPPRSNSNHPPPHPLRHIPLYIPHTPHLPHGIESSYRGY